MPRASTGCGLPGGDVDPYLYLGVAGLHGIGQCLELPPPRTGNAYAAELGACVTPL